MLSLATLRSNFFSKQKKKQKKESQLAGGDGALSRFFKKILPGFLVSSG